jgi:hypothetical protein
VDIFFNATVLVAASEQSHPHYARASVSAGLEQQQFRRF